jgi:hypothetical protein
MLVYPIANDRLVTSGTQAKRRNVLTSQPMAKTSMVIDPAIPMAR